MNIEKAIKEMKSLSPSAEAIDTVLKELERLSEIQKNKMEFCQTQCIIAKERKYYIEQLYELEEKINEILNRG